MQDAAIQRFVIVMDPLRLPTMLSDVRLKK
ncbi:hypothetical protein MNJPNG_19885 [Cupriavidus oxalaticus]